MGFAKVENKSFSSVMRTFLRHLLFSRSHNALRVALWESSLV